MTVHFDYPNMMQVARRWNYHRATGMYEIQPLEDNEVGCAHSKTTAQLVLNKKTGEWEHSYGDGDDVKRGRRSRTLNAHLLKYAAKTTWVLAWRGEQCVRCANPATAVNKES